MWSFGSIVSKISIFEVDIPAKNDQKIYLKKGPKSIPNDLKLSFKVRNVSVINWSNMDVLTRSNPRSILGVFLSTTTLKKRLKNNYNF